jgi:hypothetical protein
MLSMKTKKTLPERSDCFFFDHKPSEINYGGKMRFQQVAFLPAHDQDVDFETLVFRVINGFAEIIQERSQKSNLVFAEWQSSQEDVFIDDAGGDLLVFKGWHSELADIFFDQWCETPLLSLKNFQAWVNQDVITLAKAYRRLRMNVIMQEQNTGIHRLNYYVLLATTTLVAEMISEYFEKQLEQLGKLATLARYTLGRILCLVFQAVEESDAMSQAREKELGTKELDESCRRLLNPFVLGFIDIADIGMVEEVIAGPNPYQISHHLRSNLLTLFSTVLSKSKVWATLNLKRAVTNPTAIKEIMETRKDRKRLIKLLRRNRELRTRIVFENVRQRLRHVLREYLRTTTHSAEVFPYVSNERQMEEILTKPSMQRRFFKALKKKRSQASEQVIRVVQEGTKMIKRSRRNLFGGLSKRDLDYEFEDILKRLRNVLVHSEDFNMVRSRYGRDSNRAINWQGIRIWRIQDLMYNHQAKSSRERLLLMNVLDKRQAEIQNNFAEGNLFLIRSSGEIYPHQQQRRGRVVFLFADLRNSTETTMKLTKDTASYLTPYLTAVNSSALKSQGKRIYFAGDGYAAYYEKAADAIRACFEITAQFNKLRKQSSDEHLREAKDIYQSAAALGLDLRHPAKLKQGLAALKPGQMFKKVEDFLMELSRVENETIHDDVLKKTLANIAAVYSMPRVDVGVALTNGELFFALVGDEGGKSEEKIPIVISPQLTQAARLSGSSDLVKNYIDSHLSQPFQFNTYTWDKKLYNRGIVFTEDIFEQIQKEMEVTPLHVSDSEFKKEKLFAYDDRKIQRRTIIRENMEPVMLKGIAKPCRVYEVATMGSALDKRYGNLS